MIVQILFISHYEVPPTFRPNARVRDEIIQALKEVIEGDPQFVKDCVDEFGSSVLSVTEVAKVPKHLTRSETPKGKKTA